MDQPRTGDTIIGSNGRAYEVRERSDTAAMAFDKEHPRKGKMFSFSDLRCIDEAKGVWQEMGSTGGES